jgi:ATP-dependent DNA helicase RecG
MAAPTRTPTGFSGVDPPEGWPLSRSTPRPERLELGVDVLPGVGPTVAKRLAKLGAVTVRDLLWHRPARYEAAAPLRSVADLFGDDEATIEGVVRSVRARRVRRLTIVTAHVADETAGIDAVWFNQEWLADKLVAGTRVRLRGQLGRRGEFAVKSYDIGDASSTADHVPVYPATEDLPPKRVRALVEAALAYVDDVPDALPASLRAALDLPLARDAVAAVHRGATDDEAERGRRRLALDELLELQVALALVRRDREDAKAPSLGEPGELLARYRETLPFTLTEHQERAIAELDHDLARTAPMQRLLQGDVGSGKTVVALYALLRAVERGHRGALMAPTETLAEQHFLTIEPICTALGVRAALLTGSVRDEVAQAQVVVGTHALIQEGVDLSELAVAVVDEQHRFGVEQRRALVEGRTPHVLHMTATPIPRTLALTLYGDLAVSEIAKPPADRKPVVTRWIPQERSTEAYTRLRRLLDEGRQAYVVCPVIEESETRQARAAEAEAERLARAELRGFRVGCLHGRLRAKDRRALMAQFKARELDVLVATTVIEVGVDVPNATVMIVQEADRFGLAQLHQLRGRVGRGGEQSYCLLVSRSKDELTETARARLEALVETADGFELAERDLEIRGEGELLGTRQSGAFGLRFASLRGDRDLLELARREADALAAAGGLLAESVAAKAGAAAAA